MDLSNFREEYLKGQLHRKDLAENPFEQFQTWFEQALKADIPEPNAFSLATVNAHGRPSLRTVLLKYFDQTGFVFFTNYGSHKAHDIEENPQVCMMLPWVMLERQVIIYGKAVKVSRAESLKYFLTRPKESQLGAWVSQQSSVISGRKLLEMKLMELKNKFSKGEIPLPSFWGGYRISRQALQGLQPAANGNGPPLLLPAPHAVPEHERHSPANGHALLGADAGQGHCGDGTAGRTAGGLMGKEKNALERKALFPAGAWKKGRFLQLVIGISVQAGTEHFQSPPAF